jgi:hypothetical protein
MAAAFYFFFSHLDAVKRIVVPLRLGLCDVACGQIVVIHISCICDKSVITQNLAILSYWYRKKRLQMHF